MGACPRLDNCGLAQGCSDLKADFRYGFWLKNYCLSDAGSSSCSRYRVLSEENRQPPSNLTPSGELLATPINLESMNGYE